MQKINCQIGTSINDNNSVNRDNNAIAFNFKSYQLTTTFVNIINTNYGGHFENNCPVNVYMFFPV